MCVTLTILLTVVGLFFGYTYLKNFEKPAVEKTITNYRRPNPFEQEKGNISISLEYGQEFVKIEWNYESAEDFSRYLVEILSRDGNWYVAEDECNGLDEVIAL